MIAKLAKKILETGAPIVVGLDPMLKYVPETLKADAYRAYGETLKGAAEAIFAFNKELVDHIADIVPAVKPQIAMYEQFGTEGVLAYKKTVDYCKAKGLLVIGDVKRGDIGSTSEAYAVGHLGRVRVGTKELPAFDTDFVTVNPYLGTDGVKPFVDVCKKEDRGIFVLVKTSNPSSGEFQDRLVDGRPLYERVGEKVREWGEESMETVRVSGAAGKAGGEGRAQGEDSVRYSNVGAVVGATYPEMGRVLRELMPNTFILVPGYGAQGGKGKDLVPFFHKNGLGAIVNSSRGVIAAYQNERYASYGESRFGEAARAAVLDMKEDIAEALANPRTLSENIML